LGAHHFVNTKDAEALKNITSTFDLILDTVSANHPMQPLLQALKSEGILVVVGVPPEPVSLSTFGLIMGNKVIAGKPLDSVIEFLTVVRLRYWRYKGDARDVGLLCRKRDRFRCRSDQC
jgi:D-arabinose 1-dehydrogenase-like Zn-dependent alcohol dehydrogenase